MAVLKRTTTTDDVREKLADEILLGVFSPGDRLDEHMLAERYGVSRTPIREALKQLVFTGIVEARPHRGVFVTQLSPESLDNMFEAVADLEAVCARHAALRMTAAERAELLHLHEVARDKVKQADAAGYDVLNRRFHGLILDACRNRHLVDAVSRLRTQTTPFRRAQFHHHVRIEQSFAEHQPILEAIVARDGEAAERAMRAHLDMAGEASAELFARPSAFRQIV